MAKNPLMLESPIPRRLGKKVKGTRYGLLIILICLSFMATIHAFAKPPAESWIPPAPSQEYLVDQQYDPQTYGAEYSILDQAPIAQEFTPEAEILKAIAVEIGGVGKARIRMNLRADGIAGEILYTAVREVSENQSGWLLFEIDPEIRVIPGKAYLIELVAEEGNRTWRANQKPVTVNPFHRGKAIIKGVATDSEDLHIITFTSSKTIYVYTGAPVTIVSTKKIIEATTVTQTSTMTIKKTCLKTARISLTRTVTVTETIPKVIVKRELLSPLIYGLFVASLIGVAVSALILAKRARRARGRVP